MKYVISACLCGDICRWHGKKASIPKSIKVILMQENEIIKVCPEMEAGLSCPRKPVKKRGLQVFETCEDKTKRNITTGKELTKEFNIGANKVFEIIQQEKPDKIILCDYSPSCARTGFLGKLLTENNIEFVNVFY